ncbi:hypothetical protein BDQ94DRAFT_163461 [Aspergillus welwitschiae]|uniref:Uncharacterized protein n=1 Tax=Aspergillus welwitschiae TaxID=1341132 RepID=A0A3F3PL57_9EURO|nr:hypothetical protein BDQ94DRAFT_163461 [Aspergillus welwitschiae]RDH27657.1 hypothetical protein BDQ94DRAFT_163461 [Aspergillus welwitschiae]
MEDVMDNQILKAGDSFSLSPATSRLAGPLTRHRWGYEVDRDTSSEPYCPPATIFPVMGPKVSTLDTTEPNLMFGSGTTEPSPAHTPAGGEGSLPHLAVWIDSEWILLVSHGRTSTQAEMPTSRPCVLFFTVPISLIPFRLPDPGDGYCQPPFQDSKAIVLSGNNHPNTGKASDTQTVVIAGHQHTLPQNICMQRSHQGVDFDKNDFSCLSYWHKVLSDLRRTTLGVTLMAMGPGIYLHKGSILAMPNADATVLAIPGGRAISCAVLLTRSYAIVHMPFGQVANARTGLSKSKELLLPPYKIGLSRWQEHDCHKVFRFRFHTWVKSAESAAYGIGTEAPSSAETDPSFLSASERLFALTPRFGLGVLSSGTSWQYVMELGPCSRSTVRLVGSRKPFRMSHFVSDIHHFCGDPFGDGEESDLDRTSNIPCVMGGNEEVGCRD